MNENKTKQNKKAIFFGVWIGLLLALTCVVNYVNYLANRPPPPRKVPKVDIAKMTANWTKVMQYAVGPPKGDPKAPYTMVEFGDFCCPQCGAMHSTFAQLPNQAPVKLYFVNRPFPKIKDHKNAVVAAEAGEAAAAQGKFWPMFEVLYDHQDDLDPSNYAEYATDAGLNADQLSKDVQSGKYLKQVQDSLSFCDSIGMVVTPSILIRDDKTGVIRAASGRDQINQLLASAPWVHTQGNPAQAVAKGQ